MFKIFADKGVIAKITERSNNSYFVLISLPDISQYSRILEGFKKSLKFKDDTANVLKSPFAAFNVSANDYGGAIAFAVIILSLLQIDLNSSLLTDNSSISSYKCNVGNLSLNDLNCKLVINRFENDSDSDYDFEELFKRLSEVDEKVSYRFLQRFVLDQVGSIKHVDLTDFSDINLLKVSFDSLFNEFFGYGTRIDDRHKFQRVLSYVDDEGDKINVVVSSDDFAYFDRLKDVDDDTFLLIHQLGCGNLALHCETDTEFDNFLAFVETYVGWNYQRGYIFSNDPHNHSDSEHICKLINVFQDKKPVLNLMFVRFCNPEWDFEGFINEFAYYLSEDSQKRYLAVLGAFEDVKFVKELAEMSKKISFRDFMKLNGYE